jgi:hypothetical protein
LLVVSDHDLEGLAPPIPAIRSLRDLWGIDVNYHRVGVTMDQIEDLKLSTNFNAAKEDSRNLPTYIEKVYGYHERLKFERTPKITEAGYSDVGMRGAAAEVSANKPLPTRSRPI